MGKSAKEAARWRNAGDVWLDHTSLVDDDLAWMGAASSVTAWAVKTPERFWSRLPHLERLDVRGGSGSNAGFVEGCERLRWLEINQVRGVEDLSVLEGLTSLEFLSVYGLPRVSQIPSLADLRSLRFAIVGSMKGLGGLTGLLDAPNLEELTFIRGVRLAPGDALAIGAHRSIRSFGWFAEDVPVKTWLPVVELVGKPRPSVDRHTWPLPAP